MDRVGNVGKPMDGARMGNVDSVLPVLSALANHTSTFLGLTSLDDWRKIEHGFSRTQQPVMNLPFHITGTIWI